MSFIKDGFNSFASSFERRKKTTDFDPELESEDGRGGIEINPKELISETNVVGICSIDRSGELLYSNAKAREIFDCEDFTGRLIHEFVPDSFRTKHINMIHSFFDRKFVGERLDPDTIIRAQLKSGRQVALHLALETKVDFITGRPSLVVAFITEAATLINQSKVEKMLARATLVIFQQFVAQTILSAVSFLELLTAEPLEYSENITPEKKLLECEKYLFVTLGKGTVMGEDDKLMFFVLSSALTVLIAILPLFVNRAQDAKGKSCFMTNFRIVANKMNDFQDYLSSFETFRKPDIVSMTAIATMGYYYIFFLFSTLPQAYEVDSIKKCKNTVDDKKELTLIMSILGLLPFAYFLLKMSYRLFLRSQIHMKLDAFIGFSNKKNEEKEEEDIPIVEYSKMRRFQDEIERRHSDYGLECPIYHASINSIDYDGGSVDSENGDRGSSSGSHSFGNHSSSASSFDPNFMPAAGGFSGASSGRSGGGSGRSRGEMPTSFDMAHRNFYQTKISEEE